MKTFRYKFSRLMTILIIVSLVLCAFGFGLNLYNLLKYGTSTSTNEFYAYLQYGLMFFATTALAIILISLLINSHYGVNDRYFYTSFGFIKSKYDIKTIENIILDRKTNKLTITFEDNSYVIIVVKDEWYEEFVDCILKANPDITFAIDTEVPDPDEKK